MKKQTIKSVVIAVVAVGLLVSPVLAFAQSVSVTGTTTISSLQTQIEFLLQELATLRGQMGQGPASSSTSTWTSTSTPPNMPPVPPIPPAVGPVNTSSTFFCPIITRSLSLGSQGSDVMGLQNYLNAQGFLNVSSTGYFGALTQAAVGRWQAQNNIAASGSSGNGTFGPLSRGLFGRLCGGGNGGNGGSGGQGQGGGQGTGGQGGGNGGQSGGGNNNTSTQGVVSFSATPSSGSAPLTVQFVASAPQGITLGNAVNFGDGTTGHLGFVPVCSSCNAEGVVSHTYTASGTYNATLTNGACSCPANGVCNCPAIQILATTTVVVGPAVSSTPTSTTTSTTTASNIQQLNAPGNVTLSSGNIAEVRNDSFYFTLQNITSSSATIQITPVGCWNSFPSDALPRIVCMLAMVPIPPQTLAVGQAYTTTNYSVTLTQLTSSTATFAVN
jgi:peptidoglycan hydrolase-like protein with peptidoglycan-binding domain